MRDARRHRRPVARSPSSTSSGPARWTRCRGSSVAQMRRRRSAASSTRRPRRQRGGFRVRPDHHAAGDDHFRVVTGGAHGMADRKWFADHLPDDGTARGRPDRRRTRRSGCGARGRATSSPQSTRDDVSHDGFRVRHLPRDRGRRRCRCSRRGSPTSASSAGSCTSRSSRAPRLWDLCYEAGQQTASCRSASGSTAPPAGWRRATAPTAPSSTPEHTIVEAGMTGRRSRPQTSSARTPTSSSAPRPPATILCTLTVDDHTASTASKRYMLGREPILSRDGDALADGRGRRSYVTCAGSAPSLGKHLLMAYLPAREAVEGNALAVEYMARAVPGDGGRVERTPLFDPDNAGSGDSRWKVLVCVKRVPDASAAGHAHRRRAGRRRAARGLHHQPARGVRGRAARCRSARRPAARPRCSPSAPRTRSSSCATRSPWAPGARSCRGRRRRLRPGRRRRRDRRRGRGARGGGQAYDLVLLGNEAADTGDFQVGIRLALRARPPVVAGSRPFEVKDGRLIVRRDGPDGDEVFDVPLPAVVTVKEGGVVPRYPSVPGRIRAKKAPVRRVTPTVAPVGNGRVLLTLPPEETKTVEILGRGADARPRRRRPVRAARAGGAMTTTAVLVETNEQAGRAAVGTGAHVRAQHRR